MGICDLDKKILLCKSRLGNRLKKAAVGATVEQAWMEVIMIGEVLEAAGLDEYDRDAATSGLCGTFALAFKAACPDVSFGLICMTDKTGSPVVASDGIPFWRHVVVVDQDRLFDVDGEVRLDDLIANYCWDNKSGGTGTLLPVSEDRLTEILKSDRKSFDDRWLAKWSEDLGRGSCFVRESIVSMWI
jgi:hypothetical protein